MHVYVSLWYVALILHFYDCNGYNFKNYCFMKTLILS